jgi:hypothetical protein
VAHRNIALCLATLQAALLVAVGSPGVVLAQGIAAGDETAATAEPERKRFRGVHLSFSAGYFRPWDSADSGGFQLALSGMKSLGRDRFWIGGEIEYRHSTVDVKSNFSPDYDSVLVRYLFQYHPWPEARVSPYVGIGSGLALHVVDRYARIDGDKRRFRHPVSGGFTLLGIVGAQTSLSSSTPISAFVEARFGTTSDIWKKKGANWQFEQVGGFTASAGLRWSF